MSITPGPDQDQPDPSSFAEMTPPTNRRRVIAGVAVPVAAIASWILAEAFHSGLWYGLVAIVAVLSGLLYASARETGDRDRNRDRNRRP